MNWYTSFWNTSLALESTRHYHTIVCNFKFLCEFLFTLLFSESTIILIAFLLNISFKILTHYIILFAIPVNLIVNIPKHLLFIYTKFLVSQLLFILQSDGYGENSFSDYRQKRTVIFRVTNSRINYQLLV